MKTTYDMNDENNKGSGGYDKKSEYSSPKENKNYGFSPETRRLYKELDSMGLENLAEKVDKIPRPYSCVSHSNPLFLEHLDNYNNLDEDY